MLAECSKAGLAGPSGRCPAIHGVNRPLNGAQVVSMRKAGGRRYLQVVNYSPVDEKNKLKAPNSAPAEASPPLQSPQKEEDSRSTSDPSRPTLPWPKKRGFVPVVIDKGIDTVRDVSLHLRRAVAQLPSTRALDRLVRKKDGTYKLKTDKPVVLVLGSGWGAHSLIKVVDTDMYDVVVVSPRNHFLFTPMLPSTAVGTVEFRSLLEPIRIANPFASYFEAGCERLDVNKKVAYCTSAITYEDGRRPQFEIPYDVVVVAVGEQPATFGVPGVEKYCFFMKEVTDTRELRNRIQECFELASLPGVTEEERKRVLHFVVVGGGPTGVEFAGTLNDFVKQDLKRKYPELMQYVRVTLLQSGQAILTQFSESLQKRALENFGQSGVTVRTGVRVVGVNQEVISLKGGEEMPYGVCVWSTGNAARPLVKDIVAQVSSQQSINEGVPPTATKLGVDPFLRIVGARDAIALGDCSAMLGDRLPATAQVAGQQGAYIARMINRGYTVGIGGQDQPPPARSKDPSALQQATSKLLPLDVMALEKKEQLSELDVMAVVQNDSTYTQQVPSNVEFFRKPFEFLSLGIMAYVGNDKALTEVEAFDRVALRLYGAFAYLLWRSVYITKQVSFRNRVLVLRDWATTRFFGRDLSQF